VSDAASADARDIPLGVRRRARRLAWIYLVVAVGLIVWTVFLALSLPKALSTITVSPGPALT
jgi:hypothetical protein